LLAAAARPARLSPFTRPPSPLFFSSNEQQADEEAATLPDRAAPGAPAPVVNAAPAKRAKHNVAGVGKVR
jgi:hypothetical protein